MRMIQFRRLAVLALLVPLAMGASAASAADFSGLRAWVGKYPYDKIGGHQFFSYPGLPKAMRRALGTKTAQVAAVQGPEVPVVAVDGWIVAHRCQAHDCGDKNVSVLVHPASGRVVVCWMNAPDEESALWFAAGRRPARDSRQGCPSDVDEVRAALRRRGL
jgi:hypothetical protein